VSFGVEQFSTETLLLTAKEVDQLVAYSINDSFSIALLGL
jgi:hypothetical protein